MVDGIPHHPISRSQQQSHPARGETRGPGQGSLAVPAPLLPCLALCWEGFVFGLHTELRSGEGMPGALGRWARGRTRVWSWGLGWITACVILLSLKH